jgi:hypothetical protein
MASTSMIRRTRLKKLNALGANMAISIAKKNNDPAYKRYKMFRDRFLALKKQIIRKNSNKGKIAARRSFSKMK